MIPKKIARLMSFFQDNQDPLKDIPGTTKKCLPFLVLALLTIACYWQVLFNDFISYDDPEYVTNNRLIQDGITINGVIWAFKTFYFSNWHPLTWISHMLDIQIFGLNPSGHHLTNLLFHVANSLLLLFLLEKTTRAFWQSFFVALLFAVHPLHVESVAWVAERKDVLSAFFWFLTMLSYTRYAYQPRLASYLIMIMFFCCGLMAKPMLVTLPFVLLLFDFWPLGRIKFLQSPVSVIEIYPNKSIQSLFVEKIPLFFLSAIASILTFQAQKSGAALNPLDQTSLLINSGNALIIYSVYILKMFWPLNLAVFYPFDTSFVTFGKVLSAGLIMLLTTVFVFRKGMKRKYLVVGWLWYIGTLVPVIGFIRVGSQAMADRYTYIPLIGLFIILTWGIPDLVNVWRFRKELIFVLILAVMPLLMAMTYSQLKHWQNSSTLYEHTIKVTKKNWMALNNFGNQLYKQNKYTEALFYFNESLRIKSDATIYNNMGNTYAHLNNIDKAVNAYKEAIRLKPDFKEAHFNLAMLYLDMGNRLLAMEEYRYLLTIDPGLADQLYRLLQ